MNYEQAVAYLASLEPRGWRLGLDRMQAFIEKASLSSSVGSPDPSSQPRFIHVAGTNGKGSVTGFLQSLLVEHGFRTGAFFSPYVVDPRERVQFARELIPKDDFADIFDFLKPIAESFTGSDLGGITEFEFKTAVGFEYWRRKHCEWVALEVGLGGRLDATNVVHPACSIIVSIGLDHTNILGDTIEQIAREKAGIIKPKVPVVVGHMPEAAREVILQVARENDAPVWRMGQEICYHRGTKGVDVGTPKGSVHVHPSLHGEIQAHNAALAVAAVQLSFDAEDGAVQRGVARAYVPGRFQELSVDGQRVIVDGAHNADAARVLSQILSEEAPGMHPTVIGMTGGHDPRAFLHEIRRHVSVLHTAPVDFHRTQDPHVLSEVALTEGIPAVSHDSLESAMAAALATGETVLVTGSFYLVGDVIRHHPNS